MVVEEDRGGGAVAEQWGEDLAGMAMQEVSDPAATRCRRITRFRASSATTYNLSPRRLARPPPRRETTSAEQRSDGGV